MPGGLVEPNRRYRNVAKNPHLVDCCFLHGGMIFLYFLMMSLTLNGYGMNPTIHAHVVVKLKNVPSIPRLVATTIVEGWLNNRCKKVLSQIVIIFIKLKEISISGN